LVRKNINKALKQKVDEAPVNSGCYIFKDKNNNILYIGKAKNLKNRVKSYFTGKNQHNPKNRLMVQKIDDVEFIVTNSDIEALILENSLIKEHQPKYNILLRDDKTFPYLVLTEEEFPRVYSTRRKTEKSNRYFGPYTDTQNLRKTLKIIHDLFPIRDCKKNLTEEKIEKDKYERPCLNYNIEKCRAPCQGYISKAEYNKMINKVEDFLNGKTKQVINYFERKMNTASDNLEFEKAADYRDKIRTLRNYSSKQSAELTDFDDKDVISVQKEGDNACAVVFKVRQGKIINRDTFYLNNIEKADQSLIMQNFIQRFYNNSGYIPNEVLVNIYPEKKELLQKWLSELRGQNINLVKPSQLERKRAVKMAEKNAKYQLNKHIIKKRKQKNYVPKTLQQLKSDLSLDNLPRTIEAFDISHIQGKYTVASMVYFENAAPKKSNYRRFKIKSVEGIDDYASMQEAVSRRYKRLLKEKDDLPDLVLIDGGKGQLQAAKSVFNDLELDNIPTIGLAKRLEEIFLPNQSNPIVLPRDSISLTLLKKIRDEAHRFAISYHKKIRSKGTIKSQLDDIPGVGDQKKKSLMKNFKSISKLKSLSEMELQEVKGIGPKLAQTIWTHLHERS